MQIELEESWKTEQFLKNAVRALIQVSQIRPKDEDKMNETTGDLEDLLDYFYHYALELARDPIRRESERHFLVALLDDAIKELVSRASTTVWPRVVAIARFVNLADVPSDDSWLNDSGELAKRLRLYEESI